MYTLTCISRRNISKKLHQPFYIIVYISYICYNPFISKKVYSENLMLKIICGMVTRTIADSERFSIDFSFCKQRRVNFVGFFDSLCLSFIAEQRKKRNSKKPNAHSQFLFILKYIISQFTKQTIAGIIFSLTESHMFAF